MDCVNVWPDGSAVAYPALPRHNNRTKQPRPKTDKKASKRFKRLQCAVNLMARGKRDTIFFTVTCSGLTDSLGKLSLLLSLLRNGYGLSNYVWVRELTKSGLEHFHICGQFKDGKHSRLFWQGSRKAIQISNAWAKILGVQGSRNSIRFGWKYINNRATKWYIDEGSARYMAKYMSKGKEIKGRKCQLSQKLSAVCIPARFIAEQKNKYSWQALQKPNKWFCTNKEIHLPELMPPDFINRKFLSLFDWFLLTNDFNFVYAGNITDRELFKGFSDYLRSEN